MLQRSIIKESACNECQSFIPFSLLVTIRLKKKKKAQCSLASLYFFFFLHIICHNFDALPTYFLNPLLIPCFSFGPTGIVQLWIILAAVSKGFSL